MTNHTWFHSYLREAIIHIFLLFTQLGYVLKVFWFICVLGSLGATIGTSMAIWEKFQTSPILIALDVLTDDIAIYYPNIYLCLNWNSFQIVNNSGFDLDHEPYLKEMYEWNWESSINTRLMKTGYANFFYDLAPECNNLFSNCYYETTGCDLFRKVVTPVGICCKFTGKFLRKDDTARRLQFDVQNFPMRFYMTGKDDNTILPFDGPINEIITGSEIKFQFIKTSTNAAVRYLFLNQRQCTFDDESNSYVNCEISCLIEKILSFCSCVPWFLATNASQECQPNQYSCLVKFHKNWSPINCDCYLPCDQTSYNIIVIDRKWERTQINISLDSWPNFLYKRETTFGWVDLVVSFGSIAGCFLGYSLLTSFELLYYFTLRTYCGAVLSAPKKGINIVVKPAPKIR